MQTLAQPLSECVDTLALIFSLKSSQPLVVSDTSFSPPFPPFQVKIIDFFIPSFSVPISLATQIWGWTQFCCGLLLSFPGPQTTIYAPPPRSQQQWAELPVHGRRNHQVQKAKLQARLNVHSLSIKTQLKPLSFAMGVQKESTATLLLFKCILMYFRNIGEYFWLILFLWVQRENKDICVVKSLWLLH